MENFKQVETKICKQVETEQIIDQRKNEKGDEISQNKSKWKHNTPKLSYAAGGILTGMFILLNLYIREISRSQILPKFTSQGTEKEEQTKCKFNRREITMNKV